MLATNAQAATLAPYRKTVAVQPGWIGVAPSLEPTELGYASALALISRFAQYMAAEGLAVDTRRMRDEPAYAYEQLALAHTSTLEGLRICAMQLFSVYAE